MDILPNQTLYVNNLNDTVRKNILSLSATRFERFFFSNSISPPSTRFESSTF